MASFNIRGRYLFPFESRLRVFFNHLNHLVQGCGSLKNSQIESLHKKYYETVHLIDQSQSAIFCQNILIVFIYYKYILNTKKQLIK